VDEVDEKSVKMVLNPLLFFGFFCYNKELQKD